MQLTTEQINTIHTWWCHQLHLNNQQEANENPIFCLQLEHFNWHLQELLHLNRYFLEINLKVHNDISLIVAEYDFQPAYSVLAHIFNLALEKSTLPFSAFNADMQMTIDVNGKISVKTILPSKPKRFYDTEKMLFWDSKTNQNLPLQQLPTRELCLDPQENIDTHMQKLLSTFHSYTTHNPTAKP